MAKKAWFDEECIQRLEAHVFIPLDIQSPIHRPITDTLDYHPHHNSQQPRKIRIISNKDMRTVRQWSLARKGRQRETTNLTKFIFASINRLLLGVQRLMHKLGRTSAEVEALQQFRRSKGNLNSYEQLMKCEPIRVIVQAQLQSSRVVQDILESRMDYGNKLMAIRVLQNIRSICYGKRRWKI